MTFDFLGTCEEAAGRPFPTVLGADQTTCKITLQLISVTFPAGSGGYVSEGEEKVVRAPGLGRITGSASIETLVRVGLEKEAGLSPDSKMVVLHDFTPCVDDELEVKRGSVSVWGNGNGCRMVCVYIYIL